jgi:protein-tyrosine phosphatase
MVKVLFVCLGNICRSPMAEAVFRHKVKEAGLEGKIVVDSAGTSGWHAGEAPHPGTRRVLKERRIDYAGIVSRPVRLEDFREFDYIIAMDADNVRALRQMAGSSPVNIRKLLEFLPESPLDDVPDPYYTGNFAEVYEMVAASCDHLLAHIRERENL